ncbi:MAG: phosphatidate cytidylyltransferase [Porticoccus sp.]|nr:phosphatidate cytidylyltransferase [Porticoccus sp.]
MLKQRVITAVVMAVVFLSALVFLTPFTFSLFLAVIVIYAGWEWSELSGFSSASMKLGYTLSVAVLLGLTGYVLDLSATAPLHAGVGKSLMAWLAPWWAIALLWVQGYPSSAVLWGSRGLRGLMGFLVLVPAWGAAVILMYSDHGEWLICIVVLIVAFADIGAYFSGRRFGKHKLALNVSPKKTWEGLLGGVVANCLFVLALGAFLKLDSVNQWLMLFVLVMITVLASVLGDLLESMVKRHRGIKDSGNILPGHGGVLDRLDSLTAALPVFTLVFIYSDFQL